MRVAVLTHTKNIDKQTLEKPICADDEVIVEIKAVGLCGSDIHYYEHGRIGSFVVEAPIILGHEASGVIVEVGKDVPTRAVGERVAIEPGIPCRKCDYCSDGRYNLCPNVRFLATPPYDGAFCEYVAMRADMVYPVPDTMSYAEAALIEPFSVGLHAIDRADLAMGENIVIMGMGPIGLMTAAAASMRGAGEVIGVDLEGERLELAKRFGVTKTINLAEENLEEAVLKATAGKGADVCIETAGSTKAVQGCLQVVKRGGKITIVGMPPTDIAELNISDIVGKEVDINGVFRYHHTYPKAIKLLEKSTIKLEDMVSATYKLEDTAEAIERAINDKKSTMKLIIEP
ncbi:NAD(P)-dependent alcohol dehydrogenase [Paenalkalicoccus suaedae]|uniref:NAD(P)-dependent alcohol dehydrogenase n=1 Tax=Paenalkalicoccus suaedae TaxID=2592382 RepID=A0A859FAG9_9BACI|nr:NAD(P)-dependent alcohol dehydrogenase [Paenalkalicoccus suaedae]QKS69762.1 NAD(P)-dependent alcohol dehydrogenase [Paenalkalicoccus suaedae]